MSTVLIGAARRQSSSLFSKLVIPTFLFFFYCWNEQWPCNARCMDRLKNEKFEDSLLFCIKWTESHLWVIIWVICGSDNTCAIYVMYGSTIGHVWVTWINHGSYMGQQWVIYGSTMGHIRRRVIHGHGRPQDFLQGGKPFISTPLPLTLPPRRGSKIFENIYSI